MANQKRMHSGHMMHTLKDVAAKGLPETRHSPAGIERDVPRISPGPNGGADRETSARSRVPGSRVAPEVEAEEARRNPGAR